ncbi:MAG: signal peptidase I [Pyrinomonadaceae bacterium]
MRSNFRRALLLSPILVCVLSIGCGLGLVKVPTGAMQPTIPIDSYVAWEDTSGDSIQRFDLVLHTLPLDELLKRTGAKEDTRYIFRVIGLGGEKVEIRGGHVFVNDQRIEEPFDKVESDDNFGPVVVPQGQFFLLGDNRPESHDSRFWIPPTIGKDRIVGKVVKIF